MLQPEQTVDASTIRQRASRIGFWAAILTAVCAAAAFLLASTYAPARSGPFCMVELQESVEVCVTYPFTDVAEFVPMEYLWMYPALLLALAFVVLTISIHYTTDADRKIFSQIALSFATISAAAHSINYFIQLAVVQPSLLKGELDALVLWSQYNGHGIFIALEDLGYWTMGIAFLFIAFALARQKGLVRVIRIILIVSGVIATGGLIVLALIFGSDLEYIYEVLSIVVDWFTLIGVGVLLSLFFRRAAKES
ncbi:MAG: hypothetical protein JXJ17_08750 [Anaerolineae bacterium]|nr:hypothetical protein [Anaerolineae bacterium]